MQALPLVHPRIEALLNDEADKSAKEHVRDVAKANSLTETRRWCQITA